MTRNLLGLVELFLARREDEAVANAIQRWSFTFVRCDANEAVATID